MIILMAAALALTPVSCNNMDGTPCFKSFDTFETSPRQQTYDRQDSASTPRPMYAGERDGGNVKICYYSMLGVISQINMPIVSACPR